MNNNTNQVILQIIFGRMCQDCNIVGANNREKQTKLIEHLLAGKSFDVVKRNTSIMITSLSINGIFFFFLPVPFVIACIVSTFIMIKISDQDLTYKLGTLVEFMLSNEQERITTPADIDFINKHLSSYRLVQNGFDMNPRCETYNKIHTIDLILHTTCLVLSFFCPGNLVLYGVQLVILYGLYITISDLYHKKHDVNCIEYLEKQTTIQTDFVNKSITL
jgi:hypothetical protein